MIFPTMCEPYASTTSPSHVLSSLNIIITTLAAWFIVILKLNERVVFPTIQRNKDVIEHTVSKVSAKVKAFLVRMIAHFCVDFKRFYRICSAEPALLFSAALALCSTFIFLALVEHIDGIADDPYDALEVSHNATRKEIKQAFRRLSLHYHRD
jgi:preprotein translocase subunit Sec63